MARKTIDVATVRDMANQIMRDSIDPLDREREAVFHFASRLLMEADQYKGYGWTRGNGFTSAQNENGNYSPVPVEGRDDTRRVLFGN